MRDQKRMRCAKVCSKVCETCGNVRLFSTFCRFLPVFFDFFIFCEGVYADLIARFEGAFSCFGGGRSWQGPVKKILKIPIFGAEGDADLIDFDRFGKVISRRAGIINLIDLGVDRKLVL